MTPEVFGKITLYNGDCMDYLRTLPDNAVDFVLTDIPYELDLRGGAGHFSDRNLIRHTGKDNYLYFISDGIDYDVVFTEFIRLLKVVNACIFCSNKQIGKIMTWWESKGYTATLLVWDKPNPIPLTGGHYISNLEFIVYVAEKGATFNHLGYNMQLKTFRYTPPIAKKRIHATEKPQDLLKHLLTIHTNENDVVLDPYAGSFSTAIACHDLKRKFIGCEILPEYFEAAKQRLRNHQKQLTLL